MDCGTPVYLNLNGDVVENDGGAVHAARCELVRQLAAERERADKQLAGHKLTASQLGVALAAQKRAEARVEELECVLNEGRIACEPFDDVKPRRWESDYWKLAAFHKAAKAALEAAKEPKR